MTQEELARHDGQEGRKAYGAVNGTIYDFSASPLWAGGNHQGLHQAGRDLTEELRTAPHVRAVIERYPVVGELESAALPAQRSWSTILLGAAVLLGALILALILLR